MHFREPGTNEAETIESGSRAALLGGYALVADMPNNPGRPTWSVERIREKHRIARRTANIVLAFYAGSQPEEDNIGELEDMMKLAVGLKGYGGPTTGVARKEDYDASEFEPIIKELHRVAPDKPFLFHAGKGNLGEMINLVANKYDHRMHVCHVNDPVQVDQVEIARKGGLPVSCGVCPHHVLKTSHDRMTEGKFAEMQPPLADQPDAEKLMRYLAAGKIQIIESDHAPHTKEAKREAEHCGTTCYGVPGIEHIARLMLYQVKRGNLTVDRFIDAMNTQPANLLGLTRRYDTHTTWELKDGRIESEDDIASGAGWTPYLGMNTYGELVESRIGGRTVYANGEIVSQTHKPVSARGSVI